MSQDLMENYSKLKSRGHWEGKEMLNSENENVKWMNLIILLLYIFKYA